MNLKMKRVIILFFVAIMIIFLGGCSTGKAIRFKIKYYKCERNGYQNAFYHTDKTYNDNGRFPTTTKLIRSYEELLETCDIYNSPAFSVESEKYNSEINKLIRTSTKNKIRNIRINENILTINYTSKELKGMFIDVVLSDPWVLIIELKQKDVKNVSFIQYVRI